MRASTSVVVLSSLLTAAVAVAAPDDKKAPGSTALPAKTPPAKAPATPPAKTPATPAKAPATPAKAPGTPATPTPMPMPATPAPPPTPATPAPDPAPAPSASIDPATVKPEDMPTAVRMRRLEQRTQALKERAWQLKARVQMLKEQMLGGGAGAQALITHANEMGSSFRLIKIVYTLDGTQVFVRSDDTAESLYKTRSFDIFAGPISPGNHSIASVATYRGHGYGVFEYLSKYTFTASGSQAFLAGEGKISKVDCRGYEKGGPTTPLEKRASIECKVTQVAPEKPAETAGAPGTPGVTPASLPASGAASPSPSSDAPAPASAPPSGSPQPAATQPASAPGKPQPGN